MVLHRKTLVLLHGHGMDNSLWDELAPLLHDHYTVIQPNVSLLTNCRTMEDYADELHRLLTNTSVSRCTLIGHSMGGYIALAFAEKYPDMLEGFGLFHSTAQADSDAKKHQRDQMTDLIRTHGAAAFIRHTAPNLFGKRFKEVSPEQMQDYIRKFGQLPAEALAVGMEAMRNRPDRTHVLAGMPFPVLFIIGMDDQIVSFEKIMDQVGLPEQAIPFILAEAGHLGMIERPDASARIIDWYMARDWSSKGQWKKSGSSMQEA
jgi:pimeloyl-ACP methyl ester carboxylesterase